MNFDTFNVYSRILGSHTAGFTDRTMVLARATTYTSFSINKRTKSIISRTNCNHLNCSCRTTSGAVAALLVISGRNTGLKVNNGSADFCRTFSHDVNRSYSSCGADIRATCTFRTTKTFCKVHYRLHKILCICRRSKYAIRTI